MNGSWLWIIPLVVLTYAVVLLVGSWVIWGIAHLVGLSLGYYTCVGLFVLVQALTALLAKPNK